MAQSVRKTELEEELEAIEREFSALKEAQQAIATGQEKDDDTRQEVARKFDNKSAIVGIVEKQKGAGKVKAFPTKSANATNTLPFLRDNILPLSILSVAR